jgi:hypothetical protein
MKYSYYYNQIISVLRFMIPKEKRILYFGYFNHNTIIQLKPNYIKCIVDDENYLSENNSKMSFEMIPFDKFITHEKFDFVILDVALGKTNDINRLLSNISHACDENTRIIIHQENYLWQWIIKIASKIGLKKREPTQNWLSINDIKTYLKAAGFEYTKNFNDVIFPLKIGIIGPILNSIFRILPIFDFLKLDQYIVARHIKPQEKDLSLTICITVRDEEGNIQSMVESLPILADNQEILFVEGHSNDNTIGEIEKMQEKHPEKNIRLIHQKGIGQGDAIQYGFSKAKGEVIILYEGDGTSDPDDIQYFYESISRHDFEFIEGSRMTYSNVSDAMPFFNKMGNVFFAKWFSLFLRQRCTDVLSGIKAIRKKNFDTIHKTWGFLGHKDPFGDFELLFGAAKYGLKIGEIPMKYKNRTYGKSKTKILFHGAFLFKMALASIMIFRYFKTTKS